jgi:hypothetical protein
MAFRWKLLGLIAANAAAMFALQHAAAALLRAGGAARAAWAARRAAAGGTWRPRRGAAAPPVLQVIRCGACRCIPMTCGSPVVVHEAKTRAGALFQDAG